MAAAVIRMVWGPEIRLLHLWLAVALIVLTLIAPTAAVSAAEPHSGIDTNATQHVERTLESPSGIYLATLNTWFLTTPFQATVSAVATVVGIALAFGGPTYWSIVFPVLMAAAAAGVAGYEAAVRCYDTIPMLALVLQASAVATVTTRNGFQGSQVLFGAMLGFAGATWCGGFLDLFEGIPGQVLVFLWYGCGVSLGVLVFTIWRNEALATMGPLVGGFLIATGMGSLLVRGWSVVSGLEGFSPLPPSRAPWVVSAAVTLGLPGPGLALLGHGLCAAAAAMVNRRCSARRYLAVLFLVSYIVVVAVATAAGIGCMGLPVGVGCLRWTSHWGVHHWTWPASSCTVWLIAAAWTAWRQLGALEDLEPARLVWWGLDEGDSPSGSSSLIGKLLRR